jgi:hypothetical protein
MMLDESSLAAVCGRPLTWPDQALVESLDEVRVAAAWIWWRLTSDGGAARHPALAAAARDLIARDAVQTAALAEALDALEAAGITAVVMKGAALSHTCYPAPWARPRLDDDVLVARGDFHRAGAMLEALGYACPPQNPGPDDLGQALFTRTAHGVAHHVDLHWRPCVPAAFGGLPPFDDLADRAVPLSVGRSARGLDVEDALLLGCAHRVAHHGADDDATWLLDVHLAAARLDGGAWRRFADRALAARVARVCHFELRRAMAVVGTPVPAEPLAMLASACPEPSARHLAARGRLHRWVLDLRDHPSGPWAAFRARAFPAGAYMRARYGVPSALVPAAYVWRGLSGGARWTADAALRWWRR